VERSSGDVELDESALNIVRQAAPFGAIPNNLRSKDRDDVWVIITTFNFTNEKVPLDADNGFPR
jgi:protein TonB